jgi:hypothetical protein
MRSQNYNLDIRITIDNRFQYIVVNFISLSLIKQTKENIDGQY